MRRIFAQARKELTQIARDRLALTLALVLPLFLMMLLGNSLSLTVTGMPHGGAGSGRFAGIAQLRRCVSAIHHVSRSLMAGTRSRPTKR